MPDYDAIQVTVTTILAVCAIVIAVWNVYKIKVEASRPTEERTRRLQEVEEHLDKDNRRLKDLEEATKLNLKAQLAIIDHLTTGNHTEQLKAVKEDIREYLIRR